MTDGDFILWIKLKGGKPLKILTLRDLIIKRLLQNLLQNQLKLWHNDKKPELYLAAKNFFSFTAHTQQILCKLSSCLA